MSRTILLGVRVLDPAAASGPLALELTGDRIGYLGPVAGARTEGARVHHLDGAVVTAAFVDAHVHATSTGLLLAGLDLAGCPSPEDLLDAVAARAATRPGALIWGHGWQEAGWSALPTRARLDRAAAGAPVYLSRVDAHSALVSSGLLDRAPRAVGAAGWSAGALTADAHREVRRAALAAVDGSAREAAQRAFLSAAAALGVAVVHECAGPDISSVEDLAALRALDGPQVVGYWGGAVGAVDEARDLLAATGAHGLAGDLFVDGSIGSRTAALRAPYADAPAATGNRYLDTDAVAAHLTACTLAGVQAGFHVIGDAAADTLVAGLRRAVAATSRQAVRAAAHRVEHLEMVDATQCAVLADLGVVAGVQPVFDALWGGRRGMYADRLGAARAEPMNPLAELAAAGVTLAFGSDSPVTPLGPWEAVRAAVEHRTPRSALSLAAALTAHTVGGHRAAGDRSAGAGRIVTGAPASCAVWDGAGPLDGGPTPNCLATVHRGVDLHGDLTGLRAR